MQRVNFKDIDLTADMTNSKLAGAKLANINFRGAQLNNSNFTGVKHVHANNFINTSL